MTRYSARERLVYSTAQCLRQRGLAGSGLRGLVARSGAPWGSLQHYFPEGKDQLASEAVTWSGRFAGQRVEEYLRNADSPTAAGMFSDLVNTWIVDLEQHDYELGCPVVGAVADGLERGSATEQACRQALESWLSPLVGGLTTTGTPRPEAQDLATMMIASVEGAILMARATKSSAPLQAVRRCMEVLLRQR